MKFALVLLLALPTLQANDLDFLTGHTDHSQLRGMLRDFVRREAIRQIEARPRNQSRDVVRRKIVRRLGGFPERTPLNARVTGVIDRPDYRVEKIVFESQPRFFVTASLYLPKTGAAPYPAILYPLGHEDGAKSHFAWQHMLITFVKRGYVALAWDTIGQGERIQHWDDDLKASKAGPSTTEHTILGAQTLLVGDAFARYTIWDGIRALDYLASRPEVDPRRIGVTGNSGGGTHTAYLAALDDRLQVAAPSCYITSWRRLLETIGPQDAEQCIPGFLAEGLDHQDFVQSFAPKPYLILSGIRDFFSIAGARATYAAARDRWASAPDKYSMFEFDDGHGFNPERRLAAYQWFDRWLRNQPGPEAEPEIQLASEEELFATTTGQVNTSLNSETVFTLNQARALAITRPALDLNEVKRLIGYRPSTSPLNIVPYGTLKRGGYSIQKLTFESEPGILIPSLLYMPQGAGKHPAVVLANGNGKSAAGTDASELAANGAVVLSLDLRGFGETRSSLDDRGWARAFGDYESAMTAILCDRTLTGMRALDIVRAVDLLAARNDVDASRISGHGTGAAATALLHAAAIDRRIARVTLRRMLPSFQSIVDNKLHQGVFEQIVPGALKAYDLPDLVKLVNAH